MLQRSAQERIGLEKDIALLPGFIAGLPKVVNPKFEALYSRDEYTSHTALKTWEVYVTSE